MLTYQDWSVWISIDNRELLQYQPTVKQQTTTLPDPPRNHTTHEVSCWIASEEGREFTVHIRKRGSSSTCSRAVVYMDGGRADGRTFRGTYDGVAQVTGRPSPNRGEEAPFLFSRLSLSDDDSALRDVSHLKDLGIIRVDIDRISILAESGEPEVKAVANAQGVSEKGPVHETSKKAGAHCVSYGKVKTVVPTGIVSVYPLDKKPFVSFEFRYRSADLLRAQGIIPNTPKPKQNQDSTRRPIKRKRTESTAGPSAPSQRKVKRQEGSKEDMAQEIRALKARLELLERHHGEDTPGGHQANESKVEPLDHSSFVDDEVIDLT